MARKVEAYKNHRAGTRKGTVHKVFDGKGRKAAFAYGRTRGLAVTTLNQWMNTWAREERVAA